jgi:DNA-binding winged helix-turn-helix (wHTH) protein
MSATPQQGELLQAIYRFEYTAEPEQIVVHPGQRTLTIGGVTHTLSPMVLRCACLLLYSPRETVPLARLLDREGEQSVTNAVSKLRSLLKPNNQMLQTIRGAGYLWDGEVRRRRLAPADAGSIAPARRQLDGGVRLETEISLHNDIGVWRGALSDDTPVVVKVAQRPAAERALEREHTLWQLVQSTHPEHPQMLQAVRADFEGEPKYFACLDAGLDLDSWTARHWRELPQAARLSLFNDVLTAVAILHRLGITHRDLKPGNLFVSGTPQRWRLSVGDLGSAQIDDRRRFESVNVRPIGLTIGEPGGATPLYAAPEILRGEPGTTASDLYSLGILLFQLLRGDFNLPIGGDWAEGIDDPALRELVVDMTREDEQQRIASVEVAQQRLTALPGRRQEIRDLQTLKKVRARRPWVATAIGAALIVGFFGIRLASTSAQAALEEGRKLQLVQFISTVLESGDPTKEEFGPSPTLTEALHRASAQLDQEQPQDPVVRLSLSAVLASVYAGLGDNEYGLLESRRQLALSRALWGEPSYELALQQLRLGSRLARTGDTDGARDAIESAQFPKNTTPEQTRALALWRHRATAELNTALVDYPAALAAFEAALGVFEPSGELTADRLDLEIGFAGMLARTGNIERALSRAKALEQHPDLTAQKYRVKRLSYQTLQAQLLGMAGQPQASAALLGELIPATEEVYGTRSTRVARALSVLGQQQANLGAYADAANSYTRAAELYCREEGGHPLWCQMIRGNLGAIHVYLQQPQEALDMMDKVRAALAATGAANPTSLAVINYFSANALLDLGRADAAAAAAATLTAEHLDQAAPGASWALRMQVLKARLGLHKNPNASDRQQLAAGVAALKALGFNDAEVEAFGRLPAG